MTMKFILTLLLSSLTLNIAWADESLTLKKITDNTYAIVGDITNRTPKNLANNATFGFVVTTEGVVLIDAGGTYNGAKAIHTVIKSVTDKPVVKVINTGGQDHRWLGNAYFKEQGAQIIASKKAVIDQKARLEDQFFRLTSLIGDKEVKLTEAEYADTTFDTFHSFKLGDTAFEIHHAGQAHTPGDSFVWLPHNKVVFTGDIVYIERILGILDHSNSKSWLKAFDAMAKLKPEYLVPGHGKVTDLQTAKKDTYDYITNLREGVTAFIEEDRDISEIGKVDQSKFSYLFNFENLYGRNAQQVYTEMEWE